MKHEKTTNFIHEKIDSDLSSGKINKVITRFPPEPNGYLHIGHAKAIYLDFETALKYNGECHLRFDDTNPSAEEKKYVDSIIEDIKWLGYSWGKNIFWASDYFDQMYSYALKLIEMGCAYVCNLSQDEFKNYRGIPTKNGINPPNRDKSVSENIEIFKKMKEGLYNEGDFVLRAKINMNSPNLHLRDPAIYRIKKATHHNTGDKYNIYPMYDFAHCIEDSIEKITHSLCTLEFEVHRPLYDWILEKLDLYKPQQIEFARLNITYMVMSKRLLSELVNDNYVNGWDDPRLPTISGMKRRGFTAKSIKNFCSALGCTKFDSLTEIELLENYVRNDLNENSFRRMAVLNPIKLTIINYPSEKQEILKILNHPHDDSLGYREVPFSRELFIEKNDYMDDAPNKFKRFTKGREVRLRGSYCVTCNEVIKDDDGNILELLCTYDPDTLGKNPSDGRKVKGIVHWVSSSSCLDAEIRIYDKLFTIPNPLENKNKNFKEFFNKESLKIVNAKIEPSLQNVNPLEKFQFERIGYFCSDYDHTSNKPVFNQTLSLKGI